MKSNSNNIFGFGSIKSNSNKKSNIFPNSNNKPGSSSNKSGNPKANLKTNTQPSSKSNYSQTNLEGAAKLLSMKQDITNVLYSYSPQSRIIGLGFIIFMLGLLIYSFLPNPIYAMVIYIILSLFVLLLSMPLMENAKIKMGMRISFLIPFVFWIYYFYKQYKEESESDYLGQHVFICNPFGVCENDGFNKYLNDNEIYSYNSPNNTPLAYIPASVFPNSNTNNMAYTFWLKINYQSYLNLKNNNINSSIIINRTNNVASDSSNFMIVFVIPDSGSPYLSLVFSNNLITSDQFQSQSQSQTNQPDNGTSLPNSSDPPNSPVIPYQPIQLNNMNINFDYDKWSHYSFVFNKSYFELYINAQLVDTYTLQYPIVVSKANLYVGPTATDVINKQTFCGDMVYLSYFNKPLTPSRIKQVYEREKYTINQIPQNMDYISNTTVNNIVIPPGSTCDTTAKKSFTQIVSDLFKKITPQPKSPNDSQNDSQTDSTDNTLSSKENITQEAAVKAGEFENEIKNFSLSSMFSGNSSTTQPAPSTNQPATSTNQPATSTNQSATSITQPATSTTQPAPHESLALEASSKLQSLESGIKNFSFSSMFGNKSNSTTETYNNLNKRLPNKYASMFNIEDNETNQLYAKF